MPPASARATKTGWGGRCPTAASRRRPRPTPPPYGGGLPCRWTARTSRAPRSGSPASVVPTTLGCQDNIRCAYRGARPRGEQHGGVAGGRVARRRALVAGLRWRWSLPWPRWPSRVNGRRPPVAAARRSAVSAGVLPSWARAGFFGGPPRLPHVLGAHGRIVAILFGGGNCTAPPSPDLRNKILWVARAGGAAPLRIDATHAGDGKRAQRRIAQEPGPSYVDLPSAGDLDLSWGLAGRGEDLLRPDLRAARQVAAARRGAARAGRGVRPARAARRSLLQVEPVEVHDLGPRVDEVAGRTSPSRRRRCTPRTAPAAPSRSRRPGLRRSPST